jgi:predicted transcriptional regulator
MPLPRRERWGIIGAILDAIEQEAQRGEQARVSNVAVRANLSYDRLIGYLNDLAAAGMVEGERMPRLTAKGRQFLQEYRQWRTVLDRFGLEETDPRNRRPPPP